jgi:putative phosphoribosyl transferase
MKIFRDRQTAGRELGRRLAKLGLTGDLIVLGLPRGGVPVACEVARELNAPVDVLVVRKLGAPFNPELAVGAVAFGGVTIYNDDLLMALGLTEESLEPIRERELAELRRRESVYRGNGPLPDLAGKTAILVDDGVATGATMVAAVAAVRKLAPRRIIVAVPASARDSKDRLEEVADRVVALALPEPYYGVGAWYEHFPQLTDHEVLAWLASAARPQEGGGSDDPAFRRSA